MCNLCGDQNHQSNEKKMSRRELMKKIGVGSLMMGMGMPIIPVLANSNNTQNEFKKMMNTDVVKRDKVRTLTILETCDIHSQYITHPEFFWENNQPVFRMAGGYDRIYTLFEKVRAENPGRTIAVDCGDCFHGSAVTTLSKGEALIPILNHLRYDVFMPGNWEEQSGPDQFRVLMDKLTSMPICANMMTELTNEHVIAPYYTQMINGLKIGYVGYTDPFVKVRQPLSFTEGLKFSMPAETVAKYVDILRNQEKCDVVLLLSHLGLPAQVDLSNNAACEGVDFILGADTHERVRQPLEGKYAPVVEPGSFGSFVGRVDLVIEDGKVKDYNYQMIEVSPDIYPADPSMTRIVDKVRKPYISYLEKKIGATSTPLYRYSVLETPMDNMITDAMREAVQADLAISQGYRFSPPILPGPITEEHLTNMLPIDSKLKEGFATGKQIWDWMEEELELSFRPKALVWVVRFSGMKVEGLAENPKGKRVTQITIDGKPIEMDREYKVVSFQREGETPDMVYKIKNVKNTKVLTTTQHQAIRDYLEKNSPVSYSIEGRMVATDLPAVVLSRSLPADSGYEFR
ncbi:bifunctional metallophosphatase/5'-nucleotidase [Brevibacillus choshinensis]|uniref:bifunctional metallophosphatase/5'-nucleotidase n=1 Tax=Brevibacillus choshinensis TaxID=54911 RepID=UPI002E20081B|nr:bifunctional metallophosphatase/5'-nucleotidase [Brevibacillus choshinensis]MED4784172.1 bifunctional metallophosphatase/5'-nucleotidase [Brevibacillus choshinensis]